MKNSYLGLRVFPGPSWRYEENNNFLGTVTSIDNLNDLFVGVQWDNGEYALYGIGKECRFDLLIYDSAQIGIKHHGYECKGCNEKDIAGIKWGCFECGTFVCTQCYMKDFDKNHHFYRIDSENGIGMFIGKRYDNLKIKCRGIYIDSEVRHIFYGRKTGKVDSFSNKNDTYRSYATVKLTTNALHKYTLGYMGKVELKLLNVDNETNVQNIYRNHLRILGRDPLFNYEYSQLYEHELKTFELNMIKSATDFQTNDTVYIDCFDNSSLKKYQNDYGESNYDVDKCIGKCGSVILVEGNRVKVYFENSNEKFYFNSKILYKIHNEMQMIQITDESTLTESIKKWKESISWKIKKLEDIFWVPDNEIAKKICNKIGLIVTNTLPGDLVGVRFNIYPHGICMILPRNTCISLDQRPDDSEISLPSKQIISTFNSSFDEEQIKKGLLMLNEDVDEFTKWMHIEESNLTIQVWHQLAVSAIKAKNISITKSILNAFSISNHKNRNKMLYPLVDLIYTDSTIERSLEMMNGIISHIDFNNTFTDENGDNILHIAAKKNYIDLVQILLKSQKNIVNSVNSSNQYSALHYAVENNNCEIIEILIRYHCNIYLSEKFGKSTALHLALKNNCFEPVCSILKSLTISLDPRPVDKHDDCIFHLSASLDNKKCYTKWKDIVVNKKIDLVEDLIQKFKQFKNMSKSKHLDNFNIEEMPFAVISCLILWKSKNALETWRVKLDKKGKTPEGLFIESVKKLNLSYLSINKYFKQFYRYLKNEYDTEVCKFCYINGASVIYKPCDHKIHCEYCSFMPPKCSECNIDIEEKVFDIDKDKLVTYDDWEELSKSVKDEECPITLPDWYRYIRKTIQRLECTICKSRNWNIVLKCGHQQCEDCFENTKKCVLCNNLNNLEYFKVIEQ